MICKKNIALFFVAIVLAAPMLFLNGFTLFHKVLLSISELIALSGFFFVSKNVKLRGASTVIVVIFFYFIFNVFFNAFLCKWPSSQIMVALIESLWWLLVFLFAYVLSQLRLLDVTLLSHKMIVAIVFSVSFLVLFQIIYADRLDFFTSNFAYLPLLLLPYIFLQKNKKIRVICFSLVMISVFLSMKRTAIIAFVCAFLAIFLSNILREKKKNMFMSVFYLLFVLASFYNVNSYLEGNVLYRFSNVVEDGGSGRTEIYSAVINRFFNLDFDSQLFGRGHNMVRMDRVFEINTTKERITLSAHNDFLEVLYDYGYVGILLYFVLLFKISRLCLFWRNKNKEYYHALLTSFVITICVSLFSHLVIYPTYFANLTLLWAVMENERNKLELVYG